jgi:hypothetical protein
MLICIIASHLLIFSLHYYLLADNVRQKVVFTSLVNFNDMPNKDGQSQFKVIAFWSDLLKTMNL